MGKKKLKIGIVMAQPTMWSLVICTKEGQIQCRTNLITCYPSQCLNSFHRLLNTEGGTIFLIYLSKLINVTIPVNS